MVFYHHFIIYRFRTLHFLWALCGELVKLKGWTAGLVTQQGRVPQSWITNGDTYPCPNIRFPDGSPRPRFVAGVGSRWAAPNLWWRRRTEGWKASVRKTVRTLVQGGVDQRYGGLIGMDSLPRPNWAARRVEFVGVTSAVLLTPALGCLAHPRVVPLPRRTDRPSAPQFWTTGDCRFCLVE